MTITVARDDLEALVARARALVRPGRRTILGVVGAPGSGKSTLAEQVVTALGADAVLVSMDGFHLAQCELERLGKTSTKGAIDTFDAGGFLALVRRLASGDEDVVYAPEFRREIEEPVAGAVPVFGHVPLIVLEGNYLLVDAGPWGHIGPLLAESWFLEPAEDVRLDRLIGRHMTFGRDADAAHHHATGSDQTNAVLIQSTRDAATVVVQG